MDRFQQLDFEGPPLEVWLLAQQYSTRDPEFRLDAESRIWITYRTGFEFLGDFTSDVGWGCMIRSGQMLAANALVNLYLGRSWRLDDLKRDPRLAKTYCRVRRL